MIEKYKQPDGSYIDEDGCHYETATELLANMLNFCGCGYVEDAIEYVYRSLCLVWKLQHEVGITEMPNWCTEVEGYYGSKGAEYFMWYYLHNLKLTQHGTCVPGWLTEKGEDIMKDIETYCEIKCKRI